jgi:hypothetical protein
MLAKLAKFAELCMKFVIHGCFSLKNSEPRVSSGGAAKTLTLPGPKFVQSGAK